MNSRPHAQVVQHMQPGGIETMALDLCRFSDPQRADIIISLEGTLADAVRRWPRLGSIQNRLVFLDKPQGWSMTTVGLLAKELKRRNIGRIHTHHIGPMLYGGLAARIAGVPEWIHTEHDAWHLANRKHRQLAATCFKWFKPLVVADAGMVAAQIRREIPGITPEVVYNGIDTRRFCPGNMHRARVGLGLPVGKRLIGCAARLHPVKGQHRLISVLSSLSNDVELVLAGDGETRVQLQLQAENLGLRDRVHFLGNLDDMPAFYQSIDVFCLTSDFEGLPLSPLEAQACNTPAVVTDVGGARETVCPITGAVVPLDSATALHDAIERALYRSAGDPREFIVRRYDVRTMIREYASLAQLRWSA